MKRFRDFIGYLLGGILFVCLIPTIMWLASGMPALWPVDTWRCIVAPVVMLVGLVLSIWTRDACGPCAEYLDYRLHAQSWQRKPDGCFRPRSGPAYAAPDDRWPVQNQSQSDADGNSRLPRGCSCVVVDMAIVRRVCRLLCHHDGAGAERRKTPPPRLRRRIRRVLQTLPPVLKF